ncbi:MAG: MarR family transcriptional regulator [Candidatus Altiarchaeia archaeon]
MKHLLLFLAFLSLASTASAGTYYADISVDLDSSGEATISGISNHPVLSAGRNDSLTSKKGALWIFNLTLPPGDVFSDYVYAVSLPQGASVNYVKADSFRISNAGGRIIISGSGSGRPMSIVVQYRMDESIENPGNSYLYWALAIIVVLVAFFAYYILRRKKSPRSKQISEPAAEIKRSPVPQSPAYSKYEDVLTDRQKGILAILQEQGKPVNQTLICERLSLPKSSVSRNVASLTDLGLIEKKRIGMSTFISLKE